MLACIQPSSGCLDTFRRIVGYQSKVSGMLLLLEEEDTWFAVGHDYEIDRFDFGICRLSGGSVESRYDLVQEHFQLSAGWRISWMK